MGCAKNSGVLEAGEALGGVESKGSGGGRVAFV